MFSGYRQVSYTIAFSYLIFGNLADNTSRHTFLISICDFILGFLYIWCAICFYCDDKVTSKDIDPESFYIFNSNLTAISGITVNFLLSKGCNAIKSNVVKDLNIYPKCGISARRV